MFLFYMFLLLIVFLSFVIAFFSWFRKDKQKFKIYKIGISGKIGSGKSTLATELEKLLKAKNFKVVQRNFADELKQYVAKRFNFDIYLCYSQQGKNKTVFGGKTVGQLLQDVGTAEREVDEDFWIKAVDSFIAKKTRRAIEEKLESHMVFIISDVRFENEANWLGDQFIVRLEGDPGQVAAQTNRNIAHVSETALDNYEKFDLILNTEKHNSQECAKRVFAAFLEKIAN